MVDCFSALNLKKKGSRMQGKDASKSKSVAFATSLRGPAPLRATRDGSSADHDPGSECGAEEVVDLTGED